MTEHAEVLDRMKDDRVAREDGVGTGFERAPGKVGVLTFAQTLIEAPEAFEQAAGVEDVAGLVEGAQAVDRHRPGERPVAVAFGWMGNRPSLNDHSGVCAAGAESLLEPVVGGLAVVV